ncbi:MAG: Asp-tRNA(Asn)/Glu-tRNA(Gln) amidotransferase subunit GatB [Patescibacteria group bacterium]
MNTYKPVIGLEIHVELKTLSKMFCNCKASYYQALPNSHVCPVCLGLPGALPVPNKKAIEWTIKIGQALHCVINRNTKFDRKHYSYPDLPKGYQISQYDDPIALKGHVDFESDYGTYKNRKKTFRVHRVHLEEDTGKLIHKADETLIDFNRSGVPLVEIVTEPDFESSDDVKMFLEELHTIIRYLDVSDADMEKGTMRMEPNISVRVDGSQLSVVSQELPKYKVEVKNINSFNFVKRAIDYEVKRHIELFAQGKTPVQETRGWDSVHNRTFSQRTKEEAHDYRYFPEPDIPPFEFSEEYIKSIFETLPEMPRTRMMRFVNDMKLKPLDAYILTRNKEVADYYEKVLINMSAKDAQTIANFIVNKKLPTSLSVKEFVSKATSLSTPIETDITQLDEIARKIIHANQKSVTDYKKGKQNAIMYLVGQVMREMKGKADANTVITKLKDLLK